MVALRARPFQYSLAILFGSMTLAGVVCACFSPDGRYAARVLLVVLVIGANYFVVMSIAGHGKIVRAVIGGSLVAGAGAAIPIPFLRGVIVGMFPGIVPRSAMQGIKGACLGGALDILYLAAWPLVYNALGMGWDPRGEYNPFLAHWLPGFSHVMPHIGSRWPNAVQFVVNQLAWFCTMLVAWVALWRPALTCIGVAEILCAGNAYLSAGCTLLWSVSPLNYWRPRSNEPPDLIAAPIWVLCFVLLFPLVSLSTSFLFARDAIRGGRPSLRDRKGARVRRRKPEERRE